MKYRVSSIRYQASSIKFRSIKYLVPSFFGSSSVFVAQVFRRRGGNAAIILQRLTSEEECSHKSGRYGVDVASGSDADHSTGFDETGGLAPRTQSLDAHVVPLLGEVRVSITLEAISDLMDQKVTQNLRLISQSID